MLEIILSLIFVFSLIVLITILNLNKNKKNDLSYIQIIPDYDFLLSKEASKLFFEKIYSYLNYHSKIILKTRFSSEGIKFVVGANPNKIKNIEKIFKTLDINLEIKTLKYCDLEFKKYKGYELNKKINLNKHFLFSDLDCYSEFLKSLVFQSSDLKLGEIVDLDITLTTYKGFYLKLAKLLVLNHKKVFKSKYRSLNVLKYIILLFLWLIKNILKLLFIRFQPSYNKVFSKSNNFYDKLNLEYFRTAIELNTYSNYKYRLKELSQDLKDITTNQNQFQYQSRIFKKTINYLPNLFISKNILSKVALANIFEVVNLNRPDRFYFLNHFKKLELSIDRRQDYLNQNYAQTLGKWFDSTGSLDVVMTKSDRQQHLLICGATGSGKSTLMLKMILNDLKKNNSLALIDPHGDLSDKVLNNIPKGQNQKVVYFNPLKPSSTYSINLLERYSKPNTKEYLIETELIIENIISVFNKIFSKEQFMGHRIEYIFRNALKTILELESPSLLKVFNLINDPKYLRSVLKDIKDPSLLNFWQNEFSKAGDYQKVKMSFGVTTKIGRFLFSDIAKRVLSDNHKALNIQKLMDHNNYLIFRIAKGEIGEENSSILGTLILTKIQLSALSRSKQKFIDRKDFYLYVDEFQNFASSSFTEMLSEARKFKLYLTIAEQSLSQHDPLITSRMLANIGNLAVFKTPSPIDQKILIKYFEPYLKAIDLRHIPILNYYFVSSYRKNDIPINVNIEELSLF